jgi:hypothetical protein
MIPFFTDRFTTQSQNFDDTEGLALLKDMKKFYCDTATFGVAPLNIRQVGPPSLPPSLPPSSPQAFLF